MDKSSQVPKTMDLLWPMLKSLKKLGGSASIRELDDHIAQALKLSDEVLDVQHGTSYRTEFEYQCAWSRTFLKRINTADNTQKGKGVWTITALGRGVENETELQLMYKAWQSTASKERNHEQTSQDAKVDLEKEDSSAFITEWQDELLGVLKEMPADSFERLCQRLLRENGFVSVDVTGQSGDGGIDGSGVLRINLISFHVKFQSKRYEGSVGAPAIRDFRGGFSGRADKGLFITTGRYTADAKREAGRDGAVAVDLIDGEQLCELLKEKEIGVASKIIVDHGFFSSI
ncbi:MAG: restriction endonuclease [Gammaproteobacteria bacterium]|nr:restriction endonuclease [Gammaproteobacteria bacterium]